MTPFYVCDSTMDCDVLVYAIPSPDVAALCPLCGQEGSPLNMTNLSDLAEQVVFFAS